MYTFSRNVDFYAKQNKMVIGLRTTQVLGLVFTLLKLKPKDKVKQENKSTILKEHPLLRRHVVFLSSFVDKVRGVYICYPPFPERI